MTPTQIMPTQTGIAVSTAITADGPGFQHAKGIVVSTPTTGRSEPRRTMFEATTHRLGARSCARVAKTAATAALALALLPVAALAQTPERPTRPPAPPPITAPPPVEQPVPPPAPPPIAQPETPPPPQIELPAGSPEGFTSPEPVDPNRFAAEIVKNANGIAFGWQFAITQGGKLVVPLPGGSFTGAGGTARTKADNNGIELKMKPTMRYELASVTKNVTAVATMKLLRLRGLSIESRIAPYLPPGWTLSKAFKLMRFRHLLAHTSGINQMLVATKKHQPAQYEAHKNNTWEDLRWMARRAVQLDATRAYKNANYGLLGILNAKLWRMSGGKLFVSGSQLPAPVNWEHHALYQMDFNQKHIFTPAGIKNVGCVAPNPASAGLNYSSPDATQQDNGTLGAWEPLTCAGNAGLRLSSIELVRYLAHLRHGNIIHPDDLKKMDELRLGWDEDSNSGDGDQSGPADGTPDNPLSAGVFWHGGSFTNRLSTCAMTFSDGTEATFIGNSKFRSSSACGVLIRAYDAAAR